MTRPVLPTREPAPTEPAPTEPAPTTTGPAFDPFDPAHLADPYPVFHALRAHDPVFLSPWGDWYLTRFADVSAVLTDKRFQRCSPSGTNPITGDDREPTAIDRMLSRWMVFIDPPA
ncbi:MAG: hypothetical protein V7768_11560, partial [Dietzia cercidiphylli]